MRQPQRLWPVACSEAGRSGRSSQSTTSQTAKARRDAPASVLCVHALERIMKQPFRFALNFAVVLAGILTVIISEVGGFDDLPSIGVTWLRWFVLSGFIALAVAGSMSLLSRGRW